MLSAVRDVMVLTERVARLEEASRDLTTSLIDTRERLIRLEGLIEGTIRAYSAAPPRPPRLPRG